MDASQPIIGTLNEKPLHAALKDWYAQPGDRREVSVDGYVIDLVRGGQLIEIQTGDFAKIARKLSALARDHPVRLVHPIPREKWLVKLPHEGQDEVERRKSPKRGSFEDVFRELVHIPRLVARASFSLEVLLTHEDELRRFDGRRGWRRKGWVVVERRLLQVVGRRTIAAPADACLFLPDDLPEPFGTAELAKALSKPRRLAQQMAYCLRKMGAIEPVGKQGNAILYVRA